MTGTAAPVSVVVAALEAETAQAVSAAKEAQDAAEEATRSAELLAQTLTQQAAVAVAEVIQTTEENEENLEWLKIQVKNLEVEVLGTKTQLAEMQALILTLIPATPADSAPLTPQAEPSNVVVVDPLAAENPSPKPAPVPAPAKEKRHKML